MTTFYFILFAFVGGSAFLALSMVVQLYNNMREAPPEEKRALNRFSNTYLFMALATWGSIIFALLAALYDFVKVQFA